MAEGQCICRETCEDSDSIYFEEATSWWLGVHHAPE